MEIALWVAQILLAGLYALAGAMKTFQIEKTRQSMTWTQGKSDGFIRFVGISELLGAAGLILPALTGILPWLTPLAATGLALIQLLAIFREHMPRKEFIVIPVNVIFFALSVFVVFGRWSL